MTWTDEVRFACFFALASKSDTSIVEEYANLFEPSAHRQRLFLLHILQLCGNADIEEYFRRELKAGRFINERGRIEEMLEDGIPISFENLSKLVGPVGRVYMTWGEFAATGREAVIDDLINTIAFEEPNMPAEDVNTVREVAKDTLEGMCSTNQDVMSICRQRLEDLQGIKKKLLEEIIDSIDGSISAERIIREAPELKVVAGPKAWALGCSAVLVERNHGRLDTLAVVKITERVVDSQRRSLNRWWGIKTRRDLDRILLWLETGGHRKSFNEAVKKVDDLNDWEYKNIFKLTTDTDARNEMRVARKYGKQLANKSILGWDYCRYVALCRWGYTVGLLSEQEAWDRMMPIARELQRTFDSWEDLGCNYLIGRQFWDYNSSSQADMEDAMQRLIDMPSSPWNKCPWNMDLGLVKDANDANEINKN